MCLIRLFWWRFFIIVIRLLFGKSLEILTRTAGSFRKFTAHRMISLKLISMIQLIFHVRIWLAFPGLIIAYDSLDKASHCYDRNTIC